MFPILALIFIVVPIVELSVLIELGRLIHFWPTLALIFTTGIVGAWLARLQGRRVLVAIRQRLSRGELPGDDLVDGLLILIAGVVLVTPGLLTDLTGLLLLVPPVRAVARKRLKAWFKRKLTSGRVVVSSFGSPFGQGMAGQGDIIDVEPVHEPYDDDPSAPGGHPRALSPSKDGRDS